MRRGEERRTLLAVDSSFGGMWKKKRGGRAVDRVRAATSADVRKQGPTLIPIVFGWFLPVGPSNTANAALGG